MGTFDELQREERQWKPVSTSHNPRLDSTLLRRILDDIYGARYQFMSDESLERVEDAIDYYSYYDMEKQYWDTPNNLGYTPTVLVINLARWFVKKRVSWMFEKTPDIECPRETVDDPDEMATLEYKPSTKQKRLDSQAASREKMLYDLWRTNQLPEKFMQGCTDFFVGGTVAMKLRYLPGKGIRYQFTPTQEVFPIPDDDEPDKMKACHFCTYLDNDHTLWKQSWELRDGKCYLSEGTYNVKTLDQLTETHAGVDTGLNFLPVILFPNAALSGELVGTSYLRDLVPLFDQYNRSMSDAADSLRFNMFAITVLLNAPPDAEKQVKVSPGEVWNVGGDGVDAKKLESAFQYSQALSDFLTRLENLMHLIGEVPDITPERIRGFGLVSGVALKLLYSDLVSSTQQSWKVWESRLELMNEYSLRMLETYSSKPGFPYPKFNIKDIAGNYENRIIPHLPLPYNEAEKINMEVQKLSSSLQSMEGALTELGEKYPKRKLAEILAEKMRMMDIGDQGFKNQLLVEEQKLLNQEKPNPNPEGING